METFFIKDKVLLVSWGNLGRFWHISGIKEMPWRVNTWFVILESLEFMVVIVLLHENNCSSFGIANPGSEFIFLLNKQQNCTVLLLILSSISERHRVRYYSRPLVPWCWQKFQKFSLNLFIDSSGTFVLVAFNSKNSFCYVVLTLINYHPALTLVYFSFCYIQKAISVSPLFRSSL